MKKLIFPALLAISAGFTSLAFPENSHSQMVACTRDGSNPASLDDSAFATANSEGCSATPDKYEIVIYEMGLCTGSSPISGGTLDRTNCTATYSNSSGQTVDLAGSASITLDSSSSTAPSPNTYTYGYLVMANTFGLRGSLQTSQSTWVSTSDGSASNSESTAADFSESLTNFAAEEGQCDSSASERMNLGTMSAILTDSDLDEVTSCSSASITRLIGAFAPNTPYTITAATTALKTTFTVTDNGMSVIPPYEANELGQVNMGVGVGEFGSGPFQLEITIIE